MKKQLIFLFRYFTTTRRWRRWLNARSLAYAAIPALVLALVIWTSPQSSPKSVPHGAAAAVAAQATATIAPAVLSSPTPSAQPTRTRTPFPPEFYTNQKETDGITLAGTLLVLIAVVGVLMFFPKRDER